MKVSIIVPIYNAYLYLSKCLESLVKQTYKNIEIILINDGSTDQSEDIVKLYLEKFDNIIYVKDTNPEQLVNIQQILTIKCKKEIKKEFDYLTKDEVDKFLNSIPTDSNKGIRDYTLLMLLYDSGARAQEIINLKVEDLRLDSNPIVRLFGKGNKYRTVPITNNTKDILIKYININELSNNSILFPNPKCNYAITKMITHIIDKYSNILNKNIHPHTFRHSRAMHLLEAGVNLIYIRDFLGHNSIETTEIYAKVNENIKRQAITNAYDFDISKDLNDWTTDENLLKELLNI